ncbi:MAG: hypothetical protein M3O34_09505 [Chloroflexota bacterium]|nr:hypothetical protein [Chloroflexota bacterium]
MLVIDERPTNGVPDTEAVNDSLAPPNSQPAAPGLEGWPVHDVGPWPDGLFLRREDMYDDWGR